MSHYNVYFALAGDNCIQKALFDPESGAVEFCENYETLWGPEAMALSPDNKYLYVACNPRGATKEDPKPSYMYSFRVNADSTLTQIGRIEIKAAPTYITTDNSGKYLLSAHYKLGGVSVQPINADGTLNEVTQWVWTGGGAHCVRTDRTNRFAFLPHISTSKVNIHHWKPQITPEHSLPSASNTILQFRFDEASGKLTPNEPFKIPGIRGGGPRHYVYHPTLNYIYFSNEQGCGISAYEMNDDGTLTPKQFVSSLPDEGFDGYNSNSTIRMSEDGRFIYVLNRGHESIACYNIDDKGYLRRIAIVPTEPNCHLLEITPDSKFVFAGGFKSKKLRVYHIEENGSLTQIGLYDIGLNPKWSVVI